MPLNALMLAAAVLVSIFTLAQQKRRPDWIQPGDFVRGGFDWYPQIDRALLRGLDAFFHEINRAGGQAFISPHPEALGRTTGAETSQHYAGPQGRGTVRAADVMVRGIELQRAYAIARGLGLFSGIGVYTDTQPALMLHLDTRRDRDPLDPAEWSRIAGTYTAVSAAFA